MRKRMTKTIEIKEIQKFIRYWRTKLSDPYFKSQDLSQLQIGHLTGANMVINDLKVLINAKQIKKRKANKRGTKK